MDATIQEWLKTTLVYGLGFVMLSVLSLLFLWFLWKVAILAIGVLAELKQWVPSWFRADIESRKTFSKNVEAQTESMMLIGQSCARTENGTKHLVKAFAAHVVKTSGVGSDVVAHLENAESALLSEEEHVMRAHRERVARRAEEMAARQQS